MTVLFNPHIPGEKHSLIQYITIKSSGPKKWRVYIPIMKASDTSIDRFGCGMAGRCGKGKALLQKIHTSKERCIKKKGGGRSLPCQSTVVTKGRKKRGKRKPKCVCVFSKFFEGFWSEFQMP